MNHNSAPPHPHPTQTHEVTVRFLSLAGAPCLAPANPKLPTGRAARFRGQGGRGLLTTADLRGMEYEVRRGWGGVRGLVGGIGLAIPRKLPSYIALRET
jgi:hypothetical protein